MKADRELDFNIYTEVMGFDDWETDKTYWEKERPPHYSRDISAALPVLEKMMKRGDVFIEWWQDGEWFVCDQSVGYRVGAISANCDGKETGKPSLPLAICRFVIKVMEAENE